ncbi:MAG: hypothetical protein J2P30_00415 [Actinobacteria bacterium]|nr:hypothetical protein [Actinomycetota bacterium]
MTATKPCGCGPDAPCPAHLGDDSPTEAQQGAREALLALAAELKRAADDLPEPALDSGMAFYLTETRVYRHAAAMARRAAKRAASGPDSTGAGSSGTEAGKERTRALSAATEAVRGCNVRWATAIDDPEIVARVALAAAEPLIRAEALQSFAVNAQALTREAVDREQERRARAVALLTEALSLRASGGYDPHYGKAWREWDRKCETYLRSLAPGEQP